MKNFPNFSQEIYTPNTVDMWQEAKTMEHASGIWGRDQMLKYLNSIIKKNDTVVDLGAGAGYPTLRMAQMLEGEGRVIGVELSKAMLGIEEEEQMPIYEKYKEIKNMSFVNESATELSMESGSADVVTSFMVLHNMELEDIERVFQETARILKPGGKAVHLTMHADFFNSEWDTDFMSYKKEDLEKLKYSENKEGIVLQGKVKNAGGGEKDIKMVFHTAENILNAAVKAGLKVIEEKDLCVDEKTAKEKFGENSFRKLPEDPAFWMITLEKTQ